MKQGLFSIKDAKSKSFSGCHVLLNEDLAKRAFSSPSVLKSLPPVITEHAEDFELWKVGTFDDELGVIVPETTFIAHFVDLREAAAHAFDKQ